MATSSCSNPKLPTPLRAHGCVKVVIEALLKSAGLLLLASVKRGNVGRGKVEVLLGNDNRLVLKLRCSNNVCSRWQTVFSTKLKVERKRNPLSLTIALRLEKMHPPLFRYPLRSK